MGNLTNCFQLLLKKVGLNANAKDLNKEIISLEIGNFTYHFKEFPKGHLIIYSLLDNESKVSSDTQLNALNENHFSEQLVQPIFSYDQKNEKFILWNRQSIPLITEQTILDQLEAMVSSTEAIQAKLNKNETDEQLSVPPRALHTISG
ncbi:hypothetical protein BS333_19505 [Vibrio azureus]|uniref:Tir chaperone family protein n=1 Tax=Vibrio azureus NBRC 104587 TaxID=1219077 RepID=U3ADZ9_9VIBR|nr:CesT family type III secretion system chaperone [Vibrio azureus]AUI88508.1 hypothetical protein BS333_19505 [Vibrio azureus]GAD78146.1 hypothetical protein VAZ01S_132_00010 [Vibrio azureus NBRC 104587]